MELIGRQFGHIRVTAVVGEGGMGSVYAGRDEKLDRKVALKVLHADQRLETEARTRLLREARALSKIDHPNICHIHDYIETGDVDLLVLEYIDGRTLQEAMAESLPYSEKLRIALTVAEVLVTAHRAGIVHRDLKPENVMITTAGQVKVLDFGLARWLGPSRRSGGIRVDSGPVRVPKPDSGGNPALGVTMVMPSARPSAIYPDAPRRPEFLATAAGTTLGTPLYMSPEQARGEALTPASDMFSFGLLLQVLFSGKEPHPDFFSAREVILRVARGETNPATGAPKAITALINNLKQLAPADRLTAIQTVARLKYLMATPQRVARRGAVAAVVMMMVIGGWRYTVDLDRARAIAVAERALAQKEKAKAEDLITFMLVDLRKKLEPVGRLDVLDSTAEKALQYVQGLRPEAMSVADLTRNAKALNQLGDVRVAQGKTPEALQLFSGALGLASAAVERDPKNAEGLLVLGAAHFYIGNSLRLQGKTDEALYHMREYMETGEALVAIDPAKKEYLLERAYGHSGVALILEKQGKLKEALEHYTIALKVKEELARRAPGDSETQAELARAYNKVGVPLNKLGDLAGARAQFQREVAIYRHLIAADAKQTQWKKRLATSLAYLGQVMNDTGHVNQAYELWREELAIERELAALDPENVDWQRAVAVTLQRVSQAESVRGNPREALALAHEAFDTIRKVIQKAPDRMSFYADRAAIDVSYAILLGAGGDRRAPREIFRQSIAEMEKIKTQENRAPFCIARAEFELGEALAATDAAAASAAWQRAEAALTPGIERVTDPQTLELWTRILLRRGRAADARIMRARVQATGYVSPRLDKLCTELGC